MNKLERLAREANVTPQWLRAYLREQIEYRQGLHIALLNHARRYTR